MPRISLCVVGVMLILPTIAWANGLSGNPAEPSILAFSYGTGDQAQTLGVEPEFGATVPGDLSATTEAFEDGIYDRLVDQIEKVLAPIGTVDSRV